MTVRASKAVYQASRHARWLEGRRARKTITTEPRRLQKARGEDHLEERIMMVPEKRKKKAKVKKMKVMK